MNSVNAGLRNIPSPAPNGRGTAPGALRPVTGSRGSHADAAIIAAETRSMKPQIGQ